jgi:uncharacterized iron-regulated protein
VTGRAARGAALFLPALLLAACAVRSGQGSGPLPPVAEPGAQALVVAELASRAEVLYLGEQHDNPHHHERQQAVLDALVARGRRPALAFEMLTQDMQSEVDRLIREGVEPPELARQLAWQERGWPDFSWYWPLFATARRHGLPVIAADAERSTVHRISREGLAALGADAQALRSALPPDPAREAAMARVIQEAHCNLLPEPRLLSMVESWHARNVTMARRIGEALDRAPQVVVVAGRGHQAPGGLPDQLEALRPATRQLVVDLVETGPGPAAPMRLEAAAAGAPPVDRLVWPTPAVARPDPCEGLRGRLPPAR